VKKDIATKVKYYRKENIYFKLVMVKIVNK